MMLMTHAIVWAAFALGLLFGSFLNVCIARLPQHASIVRPGSQCLACGHAVRWYDNIPVLSWLVLRGRCRDCRSAISWSYPAVELTVGAWFAVIVFHASQASAEFITSLWIDALGSAALGFLLIGLMVMDWRTHRLPDAFTLTGTALGFFPRMCAGHLSRAR